jgi:hypothetical protein
VGIDVSQEFSELTQGCNSVNIYANVIDLDPSLKTITNVPKRQLNN